MNNSWSRDTKLDIKSGGCFVGLSDLLAKTNPIPPFDPSVSPLTKVMTRRGGIKGGLKGAFGFTLLELLISIVMLGIIILIIVGAMRLGFRSVDAGEKKMESLERIRASFNIMDSQIQSLVPLTYVEEGETKFYFAGDKESLQFSTNYSIWGGQKGYVVVTYKVLSEDNGKPALYASENIVGIGSSEETKLLDNFDALYFEYFYKDPTEEVGTWVEQWTDTLNMPEKIKVHLVKGERDLSIIIPVRTRKSMLEIPSESSGEEEEYTAEEEE